MKRVYISPPFTGNEQHNLEHAARVRAALKEAHPEVCYLNPLGMFGDEDTEYTTALADALELLSVCEEAIFCPGWEKSTGCRAERAYCMQQGIVIRALEHDREAMSILAAEEAQTRLVIAGLKLAK